MKLSGLTIPQINFYKEYCNFTDDEAEYFDLKVRDATNDSISRLLSISNAKVSVLARKVKDKIRTVDEYEGVVSTEKDSQNND